MSNAAVPTVAIALREAAAALAPVSDTARLDAELLMAHALGVSRSDLLLSHMGAAVPPEFAGLFARRMMAEPVAYILGEQEFFGLPFRVGPDVLIPRGDSEVLVEAALEHAAAHAPAACRVLDCGTGSGCLLLAVLHGLPLGVGVGIDRSPAALAIARDNARHLGLQDRARLALADWHEAGWAQALGAPFDLILANPPYVEAEAPLAPGVRDFEPEAALFAGPDGLDDYLCLIPQLPALLAPGGLALVEIGATQAEAVAAIAAGAGLASQLHRALAGRARGLALSHANADVETTSGPNAGGLPKS